MDEESSGSFGSSNEIKNTSWALCETSFQKELETAGKIQKENLLYFKAMYTEIAALPIFDIRENPASNLMVLLKNDYLKIRQDVEEINSQMDSNKCVQIYKKEKDLKAKVNKIKFDIKHLEEKKNQNSEKAPKKAYLKEKKALQIAIEHFIGGFDLHIETEKCSDNKIVATVLFDTRKPNLFVKLTFDETCREILDFDARSILSEDREKLLREKFKLNKDILGVMCVLKKAVVNIVIY